MEYDILHDRMPVIQFRTFRRWWCGLRWCWWSSTHMRRGGGLIVRVRISGALMMYTGCIIIQLTTLQSVIPAESDGTMQETCGNCPCGNVAALPASCSTWHARHTVEISSNNDNKELGFMEKGTPLWNERVKLRVKSECLLCHNTWRFYCLKNVLQDKLIIYECADVLNILVSGGINLDYVIIAFNFRAIRWWMVLITIFIFLVWFLMEEGIFNFFRESCVVAKTISLSMIIYIALGEYLPTYVTSTKPCHIWIEGEFSLKTFAQSYACIM